MIGRQPSEKDAFFLSSRRRPPLIDNERATRESPTLSMWPLAATPFLTTNQKGSRAWTWLTTMMRVSSPFAAVNPNVEARLIAVAAKTSERTGYLCNSSYVGDIARSRNLPAPGASSSLDLSIVPCRSALSLRTASFETSKILARYRRRVEFPRLRGSPVLASRRRR